MVCEVLVYYRVHKSMCLAVLLSLLFSFLQMEQYFAVSDVTLHGRCACNGHASIASVVESSCDCLCQHDTTGQHCEECAAGFQFSPWRRALPDCPFVCQSEYMYGVSRAHWSITLHYVWGVCSRGVCSLLLSFIIGTFQTLLLISCRSSAKLHGNACM